MRDSLRGRSVRNIELIMYSLYSRENISATHRRIIHLVPHSIGGLDVAVIMTRVARVTRVKQHSIQPILHWWTLTTDKIPIKDIPLIYW